MPRVERHEAVHLPGKPDAGDLNAGRDLRKRSFRRAPPVLGVLLRPAGARSGKRIRALSPRDHRSLGRDRDRLHAGGAHVEPDADGHDYAPSAA